MWRPRTLQTMCMKQFKSVFTRWSMWSASLLRFAQTSNWQGGTRPSRPWPMMLILKPSFRHYLRAMTSSLVASYTRPLSRQKTEAIISMRSKLHLRCPSHRLKQLLLLALPICLKVPANACHRPAVVMTNKRARGARGFCGWVSQGSDCC